ncbi:hypothetical protein [Phenylobacterium sp.]|uniref:hypothetical protein n=1 Tax=Phenylobacterium sp. TaxID=1871053 RepID=UPI0025FBA8B1|nr:hypothetical protein [Phenylobacterium sp.]MCA6311245.1 hypothetical protein [Phenylobacterium sp.]MCA6339027.1 hypothetical protein [Phenylobacterium sp.]MCA6346691.1 hypothetical protein [Phenylobacterium sp.]MCA6351777.1 hypothetical protein [Phenylobacterium sp.]MCA6355210.1 hypothetical protein [Phenylobacterium sp.]
MSDNPEAVDLFGDPWGEARGRGGRKRHRRLPQVAEKIGVMRATGATVEDVASALGLSEPTLRKYYFRELSEGAQIARRVLVEAMWKKAIEGNVSAAKFIRDEFPKGDAEAFVNASRPAQTGAAPLATTTGKKEAAQLAAQTAGQGTDWGDDLLAPTIQ